jgi:hypothetical protein
MHPCNDSSYTYEGFQTSLKARFAPVRSDPRWWLLSNALSRNRSARAMQTLKRRSWLYLISEGCWSMRANGVEADHANVHRKRCLISSITPTRKSSQRMSYALEVCMSSVLEQRGQAVQSHAWRESNLPNLSTPISDTDACGSYCSAAI